MPGTQGPPSRSPAGAAGPPVPLAGQSAQDLRPQAKRGARTPRTRLGRWLQNLRISRKLAVVIIVHLLHATVLLGVTTYGLKMVDASRAWVDGEGFWSKAQKEAVVQLLDYANTGNESHFKSALEQINVTLGDRQARLELEKPSPDLAIVRAGFIQANNHPDDVDNMIWLFQTFRHESHIEHAIAIWTHAEDDGIQPLRALADELHAERSAPHPDVAQVNATVGRILDVDLSLEGLEHEFSTTLGDAARFINLVVVVGTVALTLLFVGSALLVSAMVARQITRSLGRVKAGTERMARGELAVQIDLEGHDEVAAVAQAFNAMSQQLAKAMRQREEQEAVLAATVEATTDGILVVDAAGHILHFNKHFTEMWRIPEDIVASRSDERAIAFVLGQLEDPDAFLAKVKALYADPESDSFDVLAFKDGRVFERYSKPQHIAGRNAGRVWSFRDITGRLAAERERRAAEGRAQELDRMKDIDRLKTRFINVAAHELRTPLTPLRLQLHVLANSKAAPPTASQKKALEVMKRSLERLTVLVEDVLTVARLQAGRLAIEPHPVDLGKLLAEAGEDFQAMAKGRGIELSVPRGVAAPIVADPKRITQVLANLLTNALKFTPKGGRVSVEFNDEGETVRIRVTDTGMGIAPPDLPRLFSPFVQVHDTTQVTEPGSGLGLYICRQFVEAHGGAIGAESPGAGKGSTFWFTLPKMAAPPGPMREPGVP